MSGGMTIAAYVPFFNNRSSIIASLQSLQQQTVSPTHIFALDDGSTDGGAELVEANGFGCLRLTSNQGRGAARHRAMLEAQGELVVSCDATNVLPPNFIESLLPWFDDPRVAGTFGWIQDPHPRGAVGRWRARHLFKTDHPMTIRRNSSLITYGTIMRRSAVLELGNFNPVLRHTEDAELGDRLLAADYDIIFDPRVPVFCNVQNTLGEALDRYWRWYAGTRESISFVGYLKNISFSVKVMAINDFSDGDLPVGMISLLCPHYRFWRSILTKL
jgi:GT2 family glycosyltransferase